MNFYGIPSLIEDPDFHGHFIFLGRSGERTLGSLTISLRETDNRTRNTLRAFELIISDAMRQQIAWPFLKPVDAKDVPDYYQVFY